MTKRQFAVALTAIALWMYFYKPSTTAPKPVVERLNASIEHKLGGNLHILPLGPMSDSIHVDSIKPDSTTNSTSTPVVLNRRRIRKT